MIEVITLQMLQPQDKDKHLVTQISPKNLTNQK